jgi:hypothetical protein
MRRLILTQLITSVLFLAFAPVPMAAKDGKKRAAWNFIRSVLPTVESPLAEQMTGAKIVAGVDKGFQYEKFNLVIRNGVRMNAVAVVYAYGNELVRLGPDGVAVDDRRTQMHQERIPLMAFYYEDAGNGKLGKFLGIAVKQIYFSPNNPQSQAITFQQEDVRRPDGQQFWSNWGQNPTFAIPNADMAERVVHLPRKWWGGTTGLQVGNASEFTARIRVNGHTVAFIPPEGGVGYIEWQVIYGYGVVHSLQVDYLQENGKDARGQPQYLMIQSNYDISLYLSNYGVEGKQLVIEPPSFGAQLY